MALALLAGLWARSGSEAWKPGNDVHVALFAGGTVATSPADWRYVDGFGRERLFRG